MRNTRSRITSIFAGAALAITFLSAGIALAQNEPAGKPGGSAARSPASTGSKNLSPADRKFLTSAAEGGLAEVQMGQLAQQKGTTPAIKNFGQELVTDHSKANSELQQVASSVGVTLPTQPNAQQKAQYDKLSKMSGAQFDHAFVNYQIKDHEKDIAEFQREAKTGSNPAVKNFAAQTVPALQKHLQTARQIAAGGPGTATPTE